MSNGECIRRYNTPLRSPIEFFQFEDKLRAIQTDKIRFIFGDKAPGFDEKVFKFEIWERPFNCFSVNDRNEFMINLIDAFVALKNANVVHSAISPNTVMYGYGNRVYFTDLRRMYSPKTYNIDRNPDFYKDRIDAENFRSPEMRNRDLRSGFSNDVYALGNLISYYCTGKKPADFSISTPRFRADLDFTPKRSESLDDELKMLLRQMTNPDPEERYLLDEVADRLKDYFRRATAFPSSATERITVKVLVPLVPLDKETPKLNARGTIKRRLFELSTQSEYRKPLLRVLAPEQLARLSEIANAKPSVNLHEYADNFDNAISESKARIVSIADSFPFLSAEEIDEEALSAISEMLTDAEADMCNELDKISRSVYNILSDLASKLKRPEKVPGGAEQFAIEAMKCTSPDEYRRLLRESGIPEAQSNSWFAVKDLKNKFESSDKVVDGFITFCRDTERAKSTLELTPLFELLSDLVPGEYSGHDATERLLNFIADSND